MDFSRFEIVPGVFLNCVQLPKACEAQSISINLLSQLNRETAGLNALLPRVLCRGTGLAATAEALAKTEQALGVLQAEPVTRGYGEIQATGVRVRFSRTADAAAVGRFAAALLLTPATKGGLLLPAYVDEEKASLAAELDAAQECPAAYALQRCREEMCCYEDFCVNPLGDPEIVENAHYKSFTKYYRSLLQTSPVEIVCCTTAKPAAVKAALRDAFALSPRGELNYDIGTDIRMNAVEDTCRRLTEDHPAAGSVLVAGYRLGDSMEDPDPAALLLLEELLRAALAAHPAETAVSTDLHKGVLFLQAAAAEQDAAVAVLEDAVAFLQDGRVTPHVFSAAKAALRARLTALCADSAALDSFCLSQVLLGLDCGPMELAALADELSGPEVAAVVSSLVKDYLFILNGVEE